MAKKTITLDDIYAGVKPSIRSKDGKIHTLILRGLYDITKLDKGSPFVVEDCTNIIDNIVSKMQDDDYEIIDIKPVTETGCVIYTFILYK